MLVDWVCCDPSTVGAGAVVGVVLVVTPAVSGPGVVEEVVVAVVDVVSSTSGGVVEDVVVVVVVVVSSMTIVVVVVVVAVVGVVVEPHGHGASGPQHQPGGRRSLGSVHDTSDDSPRPDARTRRVTVSLLMVRTLARRACADGATPCHVDCAAMDAAADEPPIRVGVIGAGGKMGSTVCQAVTDDLVLDLVAAVDPHYQGIDLRTATRVASDLVVSATIDALAEAGVEVAVDFTERQVCCDNLAALATAGIHAVVGTTGFSEADFDRFRAEFTRSNAVIAPNFAIGAVLMMRFAEMAAPYFDSAEIIELHHDQKLDAPSGTAMLTLERMAAASSRWTADPTRSEVVEGARGGEGPGGIRVHAVRLRGLVAHQEVLLGTTGQTLSIRHDSIDRTSFMPGVLLAVRKVQELPGVTVGLDALLGL